MSTCSWFKFEPGSGQYANYFRIITQGLALVSRSIMDPTLINHNEGEFCADQLFSFIWEDMKVDEVKFHLDAGVISSTPIVLAEQVFTNNSHTEQEMSFSVNKSVTHSSTFEYGTGFTVTPGTEFSGV